MADETFPGYPLSFEVIVDRDPESWVIEVRDQLGDEFAKVYSPLSVGIDGALRMALPYMACSAEPSPLGALLAKLAGRGAPTEGEGAGG